MVEQVFPEGSFEAQFTIFCWYSRNMQRLTFGEFSLRQIYQLEVMRGFLISGINSAALTSWKRVLDYSQP